MEYHRISNVEFDNVRGGHDFADAMILSADYDGEPMSEEQLNSISSDLVYDLLMDHLY